VRLQRGTGSELLDEVHYILEKYRVNFLLTGSSARRLRKQQ